MSTEDNVLNVYSDQIQINFQPKTKNEEKTEDKEEIKEEKVKLHRKSKIIAILLALFLGRYGVHKFYLDKPALGLIYLIFSRFEIMVFIGFVDALIYFFMNDKAWIEEYGELKVKKHVK